MDGGSVRGQTGLCGRLRYRPANAVDWPGTDRASLGAFGERVAAAHLVGDGMVLLARNWRRREGELDLVVRQHPPDLLVFCEVKTRRTGWFGSPLAAVVPAKAARIRRLAWQWMTETGTHHAEVRFDVVAVLVTSALTVQVEHLRGVF